MSLLLLLNAGKLNSGGELKSSITYNNGRGKSKSPGPPVDRGGQMVSPTTLSRGDATSPQATNAAFEDFLAKASRTSPSSKLRCALIANVLSEMMLFGLIERRPPPKLPRSASFSGNMLDTQSLLLSTPPLPSSGSPRSTTHSPYAQMLLAGDRRGSMSHMLGKS